MPGFVPQAAPEKFAKDYFDNQRAAGVLEKAGRTLGWEKYTPTIGGFTVGTTGAVASCYAARDGATGHLAFLLRLGTGGAGGTNLSATLPAGWVAQSDTYRYQVGKALLQRTGVASYDGVAYVDPGGTVLRIVSVNVAGSYGVWEALDATHPFTWVAGDLVVANITFELDPA